MPTITVQLKIGDNVPKPVETKILSLDGFKAKLIKDEPEAGKDELRAQLNPFSNHWIANGSRCYLLAAVTLKDGDKIHVVSMASGITVWGGEE
jgi:hypothetical protein